MILFSSETIKIDLSEINITFSEKNSFFNTNSKTQYTFPFKIPRTRSFLPLFEFVENDNSVQNNLQVKGVLFVNDKYYDATLSIVGFDKDIKAVFYYEKKYLPIFNKQLKELPFNNITVGDDMIGFATQTIQQNYPNTKINFCQVYHPEKYADNDYGLWNGFINHNVDGVFQGNTNIYQMALMNELRPFVYLKEIFNVIFNQEGYSIAGNVITDELFSKILLYHDNAIFYTNKDYENKEDLNFIYVSTYPIQDYADGIVYYDSNLYKHEVEMPIKGTFTINIEINGNYLVNETEEFGFVELFFDNNNIGHIPFHANNSDSFSLKLKRTLEVSAQDVGKLFRVELTITATSFPSVNGNIEIKGNADPLYKEEINLADLLPKLTVFEFIKQTTSGLNIIYTFDHYNKIVYFNYFKKLKPTPQNTTDLSGYATINPSRNLSKLTGINLEYDDKKNILLDKSANIAQEDDLFKSQSSTFSLLSNIVLNNKNYVSHQNSLSFMFFEANNEALPMLNYNGKILTREGYFVNYLKEWYYNLLNSDEYNINIIVPSFISIALKVDNFVKIFNSLFLIKDYKQKTVNPLFNQLNLNLFKFKKPKSMENIDVLSPIALISSVNAIYVGVLDYYTTVNEGGISADVFYVELFGHFSYDPQGLQLFYTWEVISSPETYNGDEFTAIDNNPANVLFRRYSYNSMAGDYTVRLTVTNSLGLSSATEIIVHVSDVNTTPVQSVIISHDSEPSVGAYFYTVLETININYNGFTTQDARIIVETYDGVLITTGTVSTTPITDVTQLIQEVSFPGSGQYLVSVAVGTVGSSDYKLSNKISFYVWN